jgi:N-acetylglutamate synthase-like GNAT family acetyltransferase
MATIRRATEKDIPRLLELYRQLAFEPATEAPVPPDEDCRRVIAAIAATPGQDLLVIEEDDTVVGTAMLVIVPCLSHHATPWAAVENVVVDEAYRHRGIGKTLMEEIAARCRAAKCYKIQLLSNNKRPEAHRFYRALGFETSAQGFRLYL